MFYEQLNGKCQFIICLVFRTERAQENMMQSKTTFIAAALSVLIFTLVFFSEIDVVDTTKKAVAAAPALQSTGPMQQEIVKAG